MKSLFAHFAVFSKKPVSTIPPRWQADENFTKENQP
jgi:hypothetical protein